MVGKILEKDTYIHSFERLAALAPLVVGARFQRAGSATFKIFEHVAQLLCGSFGIEPKNPADDMVARVLSVRLCELKGIDFDGYDPPDD